MAAFTFSHIWLDSHTLQRLPFQQAHYASLFMNDPGNAQPPAAGWLFPHEWQEPMNGDSGENDDDVPEPEDYSDYDTTGEFTLR